MRRCIDEATCYTLLSPSYLYFEGGRSAPTKEEKHITHRDIYGRVEGEILQEVMLLG